MTNVNKKTAGKNKDSEKTTESKSPVTVKQMPDGTFEFSGGRGGFNIVAQKNKALEPYGKCIWNYGVVLELVPGEKQSAINQQIGNARFVHNNYLHERKEYYNLYKKTLTISQYQKDYLPKLKEERDYLKTSDKFVYENACRNVDNAYNRFFKGEAGFPKYASYNKPNGNSFTTNYTNNNIELKMIDRMPYVKLPKLGYIRFVLPKGKTLADIQPHGTSIKAATVTRSNTIYRISIRMEAVIDKPVFSTVIHKDDIMSVDLGLKDFGVFGNLKESDAVPNPKWIQVHAKRLRRFQQSLSRKQYDHETYTGSRNWEKARLKVVKEQRKIADQRKDFHHKLSRAIADNCTAFICEDLAVKNMMKNRHLAKAIASVGWSQFLTMVKYKMERAGKYFRKVSRWYPSSQTCGCCGYKNADVKDLAVRKWVCPKCGTLHDRDINAQQNIFRMGMRLLQAEGIKII
jgi:putative transposase